MLRIQAAGFPLKVCAFIIAAHALADKQERRLIAYFSVAYTERRGIARDGQIRASNDLMILF
jgi:hypothetical protein